MVAPAATIPTSPTDTHPARIVVMCREGMMAGLLGAGTIAVWFLFLDGLLGRPFFTPSILGTALFRGIEALVSPERQAISVAMVLLFTLMHGLIFCLLGLIAAWLVQFVERSPSFGFGIVLLVTVFMYGFIVFCMVFAEPVLRTVTWPAVLIGNLLATAAMVGYFWRCHPGLTMEP